MAGEVRSEAASTAAVKSEGQRSIAPHPLVSSAADCPTASLVAPSLLSLWRFLHRPVADPFHRCWLPGLPVPACCIAASLHHGTEPPSQQAQDEQHSCTPHLEQQWHHHTVAEATWRRKTDRCR
uniref:Uncharacterized protein n=1 Tax=Oryza punctata TaxID=4537 RepID=A0A0E0KNQ7_ORYPU